MFIYEKKLQYPVKIKNTNPKLASVIISQYGGPDGELGASLRYLSQRYSMPYAELKGLLTDIGTEELGHLEMIGAIVHQLTRDLTEEQIRTAGFDTYFVDRTAGVYPTAASGFPWTAGSIQSTGDVIATVAQNPDAIGYASLSAVKDTVKALTVGGVAPSEDTVKDGSYVVQRPFVLVTKDGEALSETAQAFYDYALDPAQAELIGKAGAVAVN